MDAPSQPDLEPHPDDWTDLQRRRDAHRRWFFGNQPKRASEVIAEVMQRRGYATIRQSRDFSEAWTSVAGADFAAVTEPGALKRGTLEVTVANSLVLQELTFQKQRLLADLQVALPDAGIKQLRFRVGKIG